MDDCEGVKRLGAVKSKRTGTTEQHCKKVCLQVKKPKPQKRRCQFKVKVFKQGDEQDVSRRSPRKCPKFRFIAPFEAEAKRKQKVKKNKVVCLKMKKNMSKSKNQSCQISTKAQSNEIQLQQLTSKCRSYGYYIENKLLCVL